MHNKTIAYRHKAHTHTQALLYTYIYLTNIDIVLFEQADLVHMLLEVPIELFNNWIF